MALSSESKPVLAAVNPSEVFEQGKIPVTSFTVTESDPSAPPKSVLVVTPSLKGSYSVILFLHGFSLTNSFYSDLLLLIASHGYILVAPQLYTFPPVSEVDEINLASNVISWLPSGLQSLLPEKVDANVAKLTVVGHSRGGKTAFALALGYGNPPLPFSAVIGLDPVAGTKCYTPEPHILTFVPQSFNISEPIMVIGTGLGSEKRNPFSCPCAPESYNYAEFFKESKPTSALFVAAEYGHMDMLNDDPPGLIGLISSAMCKNGKGPRDLMRRCCAGLVVAFLKAYLENVKTYLTSIYLDPGIAPTKLDPVEIIEKSTADDA